MASTVESIVCTFVSRHLNVVYVFCNNSCSFDRMEQKKDGFGNPILIRKFSNTFDYLKKYLPKLGFRLSSIDILFEIIRSFF